MVGRQLGNNHLGWADLGVLQFLRGCGISNLRGLKRRDRFDSPPGTIFFQWKVRPTHFPAYIRRPQFQGFWSTGVP